MAIKNICDVCESEVRGIVRHLKIEWEDNAQRHPRKYDLCRTCVERLNEIEGGRVLAGHGLFVLIKNAILDINPNDP